MGSLPEWSPEPVLEHCHLHTSTRRNVKFDHFEVIEVFTDQSAFAGLGEWPKCSEELVQTAWALLLRRYLGNDIVSFAVLPDRRNDHRINNHAKFTSPLPDGETCILQYHIPAKFRLAEIRPDVFPAFVGRVSERAPINTALCLSISPHPRNGERNGELLPSANYQHDTLNRNVSLFLEYLF